MIDKNSQTWETVSKELDGELLKTQQRIMARGMSVDDTQYWRGYHAALLKIKALPDPVAAVNVPATTYAN
jgi:hypothetical protein